MDGGILPALGATLITNSMKRRTHMSFSADTQNTGNISRAMSPLRIPARISSSVSEPFSKNNSMSCSSFSAAASINALCSSCAFSSSSLGMGSTSGLPPSGFHWYISIFKTSITRLNPSPGFTGYCICTTFEPKAAFACSIVWSKFAFS